MDPGDGRGDDRLQYTSASLGAIRTHSNIRHDSWFDADDIRECTASIVGATRPGGGSGMTAPTKNRTDVDVVGSRDQAAKQMSSVEADKRAVERVIHLYNEIFAKGMLPAL
jgi:hypothetical protein